MNHSIWTKYWNLTVCASYICSKTKNQRWYIVFHKKQKTLIVHPFYPNTMKTRRKIIILLMAVILLLADDAFAQNIYDSINVGGRWRTFMTHLPRGYTPSRRYPMILAFHGGQNGEQQAQLGWRAVAVMSELNEKSDNEGFIVVYPEGTVINGNRTWNGGGCCPPAMNQNIDDVGFTARLLDSLIARFPVDTQRIYAAGSSNGAMLCFRLACQLSHRFAAIATISATHMFTPCTPARPIPIINFHSYMDSAVPFQGGIGEGPSGVRFTSQDSTMNLWRRINACSQFDTVINGRGMNYDFWKISRCSCGVEFHQYTTTDGGHSWPGGIPNNNPVSVQINATNLLWQFFRQYTLACVTTTGVQQGTDSFSDWNLYPNPSHEFVNIPTTVDSYTILNTLGQRVAEGIPTQQRISIDHLPAGVYYVQFRTAGGERVMKVLIKH